MIDVRERKRKYFTAYCHRRNAVRTFKRSRIKSIEPVKLSLGIQESLTHTT
jgi:predicted DNA-binding transcriptional regulator YafY